jgi:hypothetical protein
MLYENLPDHEFIIEKFIKLFLFSFFRSTNAKLLKIILTITSNLYRNILPFKLNLERSLTKKIFNFILIIITFNVFMKCHIMISIKRVIYCKYYTYIPKNV